MNGTANTYSQSRRRLLQALAGGAVLAIAGRTERAHAEPTRAPDQTAGELKISCDKLGGVYIESKKDDVQACFWPNKDKTVCKFNGTGCWNYPPPKAATSAPDSWADPFGTVNWADLEELAGVDDPAAGESATTPATAAPETTTNPRRRKRRGKRRKH